MERLFLIIGRINSVLFLLVLCGAALSIGWVTFAGSRWQHRGEVEVAGIGQDTKKLMVLNFERIENIPGTGIQMLRLVSHEKQVKFVSGGYGEREIRNILFLKGKDNATQWLFKSHKNLILVASQLQEETSKSKDDSPSRALYFEYVADDSNGDGQFTNDDYSNVGLTNPDGSGFVEVLHGVNRVLSYEMLDQQQLSIIYQKGAMVRVMRVSLNPIKSESDREIINVATQQP